MADRIAKSLAKLQSQINAKWPNRDKASDGWIGDKAHQNRKSDHNPNSQGVVQALDIDADLMQGFDGSDLADKLIASRDTRIKYLISEGRIIYGSGHPTQPAWVWKKYTGPNGHFHHLHISVKDGAGFYDDDRDWSLDLIPSRPGIVKGSPLWIQQSLNKLGAVPPLKEDGVNGPLTQKAIVNFIQAALDKRNA